MDNIFKLLALEMSLGLGALAFVVWGRATFPALAAASDRVAQRHSAAKAFGIGLAIAVVALLLLKILGPAAEAVPPLRVGVLLLLAAVAVTAYRGALALWADYGRRILNDEGASELQASLAGGTLLTGLLLLFPAGPIFFAYVGVRALGTGVLLMVEPRTQGHS
ncbi:MAG: hypothetical protein KGJ84_08295 [Elusimicrobia bacterium]|nr:hypothetical protein [Elusimicrobiota bacterium]